MSLQQLHRVTSRFAPMLGLESGRYLTPLAVLKTGYQLNIFVGCPPFWVGSQSGLTRRVNRASFASVGLHPAVRHHRSDWWVTLHFYPPYFTVPVNLYSFHLPKLTPLILSTPGFAP